MVCLADTSWLVVQLHATSPAWNCQLRNQACLATCETLKAAPPCYMQPYCWHSVLSSDSNLQCCQRHLHSPLKGQGPQCASVLANAELCCSYCRRQDVEMSSDNQWHLQVHTCRSGLPLMPL
jgi:hypothetical protein